jgi:hypothetical protein
MALHQIAQHLESFALERNFLATPPEKPGIHIEDEIVETITASAGQRMR